MNPVDATPPMNTGNDPLNMHAVKEISAVSLADEKLLLDPQQKVQLFLLVSYNEISAALFSPKKNTFLSLESVSFPSSDVGSMDARLKQFLQEKDFSRQAEITASKIIFVSNEHTLLPASFFRTEDAEAVFHLNYDADPRGVVCSQKIKCFDAQLIYRLPAALLGACRELLPSPVILHHTAGMMENFYLQYKNQPGRVVLLNIRPGAIDLAVKAGRQLILLNSFTCMTPEDILYHTLNAYEQLQLNPESEKLVLSGRVERDSAVIRLLFKYIRQVEFAGRPSVAGYSYVFDALPSHFYHDLFTQVLCES